MSPTRLQLVSCPSGIIYLSVYLRSLLDCGLLLPGNRLGSDIGSLSFDSRLISGLSPFHALLMRHVLYMVYGLYGMCILINASALD